jgi:hypothetical protein
MVASSSSPALLIAGTGRPLDMQRKYEISYFLDTKIAPLGQLARWFYLLGSGAPPL